jgi:transmembrane sensor
VKDEAAAWVVRLSGPDCTAADHAAFDAWRDASPEHEVAYEREAATWERLDRLQALRPGESSPDPDLLTPDGDAEVDRPSWIRSWAVPRRAAAALIGAAAIGAALTYGLGIGADPAYATAIGEQRVVVLDDGSRVELNTNSEIRVHYRAGRREVELVRGEALFDVAADGRPFVVTTSDASFTANTSELAVRLRDDGATVTVREGAVQALPANAAAGQTPPVRVTAGYSGLFGPAGGRAPQPISRDEMTRSLAWQQGAIALDGQPLAEAVAEFNRYNVRQIVIADQSIAGFRLGGYFRTNDVSGFVRALQTTFPVRAASGPDGSVRLSRSRAS